MKVRGTSINSLAIDSEDEFFAAQARKKKRELRIKIAKDLGLVLDLSRMHMSVEFALRKAREGYYAYVCVGGCIYQMNTLHHPRLDCLLDMVFAETDSHPAPRRAEMETTHG